MIVEKNWKLKPSNCLSTSKIKAFKKHFNCSEEMARLLLLKGLETTEQADKFINCSLNDFHDPYLLNDMDKAVERIKRARMNNEKVIVFGDYDTDGTISTSVLTRVLRKIGTNKIIAMTAHRKSGYGLNLRIVNSAKKLNVSLIITCDCGTNDFNQIELAKSFGIDVIVIDHHEPMREIQPYAFINPKRHDSSYPFKELCAAGVVFKVIQALEKSGEPITSNDYLDYISIATIADVVPVLNENRIIAKFGMRQLSMTKHVPLLAIINSLSLLNAKIVSEHIGFMIGPRLNAPGRLSSANITLKFLLCDDYNEAVERYRKINLINQHRKIVEHQIKDEAIELLKDKVMDKVLVLGSETWHRGVIGIVASVICDYYTRPTFLIAIENGIGYGSARNIEEFPLLEAFEHCKDLLIGFGGHKMAAGFKINAENVDAFRKKINEFAEKFLKESSLIPYVSVYLKLNEKRINFDFLQEFRRLEPFGYGNEVPYFILEDISITDCELRNDEHLFFKAFKEKNIFTACGFWMKDYKDIIKDNAQQYDIVFELTSRVWQERNCLQLLLLDLKERKLLW